MSNYLDRNLTAREARVQGTLNGQRFSARPGSARYVASRSVFQQAREKLAMKVLRVIDSEQCGKVQARYRTHEARLRLDTLLGRLVTKTKCRMGDRKVGACMADYARCFEGKNKLSGEMKVQLLEEQLDRLSSNDLNAVHASLSPHDRSLEATSKTSEVVNAMRKELSILKFKKSVEKIKEILSSPSPQSTEVAKKLLAELIWKMDHADVDEFSHYLDG
ncbi:hypothetical protein ACTPOE_14785 [Castellaniella sp. WN]